MKSDTPAINVSILGKDFMVACSDEERPGLIAAAKLLDNRMREIRDSGRVLGTERCAVMAALNMAHELLQTRNAGIPNDVGDQIRAIQRKIEGVLQDSAQQL